MKRFTHYLSSLLVIAAFGLYSCSNSDDNPSTTTINYENNVPDGTIRVNYSVQVVPGNLGDEGRAAGVLGATVQLTQNNEVVTAVTDQSGIANFPDMWNGTVTGAVFSPATSDYITMNFTANIDAGEVNTDVEQIRYSSSTVTIFERNSGVQGRIWADYQGLLPPGVDPPNLSTGEFTRRTKVFVVYEMGDDYPMGSGNGALTNVSMEVNTIWQESNALGQVNMQDLLPGTVDGVLSARFFMEDVAEPDPTPGREDRIILYNIQPISNSEGIELNLWPGST